MFQLCILPHAWSHFKYQISDITTSCTITTTSCTQPPLYHAQPPYAATTIHPKGPTLARLRTSFLASGLLVLAQLIVFLPVISNLIVELVEPPLCSTLHLLSVPAWPDELLCGSVLHKLQLCSAILLYDRLFVVIFYYYSQLGGAHKKVGSKSNSKTLVIPSCIVLFS